MDFTWTHQFYLSLQRQLIKCVTMTTLTPISLYKNKGNVEVVTLPVKRNNTLIVYLDSKFG